jgi:hypothetical protein
VSLLTKGEGIVAAAVNMVLLRVGEGEVFLSEDEMKRKLCLNTYILKKKLFLSENPPHNEIASSRGRD